MESGSSGMMAGINAARRLQGLDTIILPPETMTGSLSRYIADESVKDFQPMGANLGILPPLPEHIRDKRLRAAAHSQRALEVLRVESGEWSDYKPYLEQKEI